MCVNSGGEGLKSLRDIYFPEVGVIFLRIISKSRNHRVCYVSKTVVQSFRVCISEIQGPVGNFLGFSLKVFALS
jgi:hypothetical protein